jgi:hypothetical protein
VVRPAAPAALAAVQVHHPRSRFRSHSLIGGGRSKWSAVLPGRDSKAWAMVPRLLLMLPRRSSMLARVVLMADRYSSIALGDALQGAGRGGCRAARVQRCGECFNPGDQPGARADDDAIGVDGPDRHAG